MNTFCKILNYLNLLTVILNIVILHNKMFTDYSLKQYKTVNYCGLLHHSYEYIDPFLEFLDEKNYNFNGLLMCVI